jgi:hypothetical protein
MVIICSFVYEAAALSDYAQQSGRSSAGPIHAIFPFADCLLARAQMLRQPRLSQVQMLPQGAYLFFIPLPFWGGWLVHAGKTIHGLV